MAPCSAAISRTMARPRPLPSARVPELPPGIELRPVPNEVTARVPQTRDYRYAVGNGRVLLVGTSRIVAGVFAGANAPVSEGRRGP